MPVYIGLCKFTSQSLTTIKDSPQRFAASAALAEKMGIRIIGNWVTLGEYDIVTVAEAPDDETAARYAMAVASQGGITTQTMRAFTVEEFARLAGGLSG